MRAPGFWYPPAGTRNDWRAVALMPLSRLWQALSERRIARGDLASAGVPVICVGNITAGGAGKTPTVIALVEHLRGRGFEPHVVSRGHGGRLRGPVAVDPRRHKADEVGDEPLLLAAFAPTWVARDRAAGARAARAAGADIVVLDDGFQNPGLAKDIGIVVVDAGAGFGNGRIIPAGPLRETVAAAMARADLVIVIGSAKAQLAFRARWGGLVTRPQIAAEMKVLPTGTDWAGGRFLAFAGIGRPEKFFETLRAEGAVIVRTEALDDHAALSPTLMHRLEAEAMAEGAQLVTTEKDATRLPAEFATRVLTLPVRLQLKGWPQIDALLAAKRISPSA